VKNFSGFVFGDFWSSYCVN